GRASRVTVVRPPETTRSMTSPPWLRSSRMDTSLTATQCITGETLPLSKRVGMQRTDALREPSGPSRGSPPVLWPGAPSRALSRCLLKGDRCPTGSRAELLDGDDAVQAALEVSGEIPHE